MMMREEREEERKIRQEHQRDFHMEKFELRSSFICQIINKREKKGRREKDALS